MVFSDGKQSIFNYLILCFREKTRLELRNPNIVKNMHFHKCFALFYRMHDNFGVMAKRSLELMRAPSTRFFLKFDSKIITKYKWKQKCQKQFRMKHFLGKKFASLLCRCWQHKTSVSWKRCLTNMQRFRVTQSRRRSSRSSVEIAEMGLWLSSNVCEIVMLSSPNCFTTQWRWVCHA